MIGCYLVWMHEEGRPDNTPKSNNLSLYNGNKRLCATSPTFDLGLILAGGWKGAQSDWSQLEVCSIITEDVPRWDNPQPNAGAFTES